MSFLKLKKGNVCRICLRHEVNINWNDEILEFYGVSYKDCYYKYTYLEEMDPDPFPPNLCDECAEELQNAHKLIEKALKSLNILNEMNSKYVTNMDEPNNSTFLIKSEIETVNMDTLIQRDEDPCFALCEIKTDSKSENYLNELRKTADDGAIVEPTYFIEIGKGDLSAGTPLEKNFDEPCDSEVIDSLSTRKVCKKRNKGETSSHASFEPLLCATKKTRKRKSIILPEETALNKKNAKETGNNDTTTDELKSEDSSLEIRKKNPAVSAKKSRERYLLMCSYCSLKVEGLKKLEKHEATHNENRERTEQCPKCGIKLYTEYALILHMKIHDTNRQKNHKCEFCEKAFFNKGALNVHRRIHLGLMIKCQMCEKEFYRQVDLDKHLLKHSASPLEKNVGQKKYVAQCQYCNKSILTDKLKEHIAIHMDQPQVKCKICDKNFFSRIKCTKHLRRFHGKTLNEYEEFIHYYVDRNRRLSSLMIKQQLVVQPLNKLT